MEHRRSGRPLSIEITGLNAGSGPELRRLYLFCFLALSAAGTCTVAIQNSEITPSNEPLSLSPPHPLSASFQRDPEVVFGPSVLFGGLGYQGQQTTHSTETRGLLTVPPSAARKRDEQERWRERERERDNERKSERDGERERERERAGTPGRTTLSWTRVRAS